MTAPQPATPGSDSVRARHYMLPGSHERRDGPECVCGEEWSRWDDMCARQYRARAAAYRTNPSSEETHRGR